jgi:hypothetical protein
MATSLYDLSIGSYLQTLGGAVTFLEKGATHIAQQGIDPAEIVSTSLYQDMAPFHFQAVCIVHHSLGAINGMRQGEFGPPAGFGELDYAGLQKLVADALDELKGLDAHDVNQLAGGEVIFKLGETQIPFTNENFVMSFSLPNLYFHATTAYDILRQKGVPLGKRDFLGPMRMGT